MPDPSDRLNQPVTSAMRADAATLRQDLTIAEALVQIRERGIGVLITDHNVRETLRITDRAYIVHGGVIFKSGTPDSLAADDEVRRIYLGAEFRLD